MAGETGRGDVLRYPRPVQARTTIRGVLLLQLLANTAGALVILVYLRVLFPTAGPSGERTLGLNLAVLGIYLLVIVLVALPVNWVILNKAMRWVHEGREPTTRERRETLGQPLFQTMSAFLGWVSAAWVFSVVNDDARRIAAGVLIAGLVTCSLLYLLLERHFRPVFALALENAPLPRVRREITVRIMLSWWLASAIPLLAIGLAPLFVQGDSVDLGIGLTVAVVLVVAGGGLVLRAAAAAVSRPVNEVREAMGEVADGDLDTRVAVTNIGELGQLQVGFNQMVAGLRERRRLQELFGRQVGTEVARQALEADPRLGGEEREITALFVDVQDFTAFTERHSPSEVVTELNEFFGVVIRVVMSEGGWVNKFEGDAALCLFGAPGPQPDHAARALRAAARLPGEVAALATPTRVGIGVATGPVIAGNIGTEERYEYTVIGDAVNVASRLTELAKSRDPAVLASEQTIRAAAAAAGVAPDDGVIIEHLRWEPAETVKLRGKQQPVTIYQPCDGRPGPSAGTP